MRLDRMIERMELVEQARQVGVPEGLVRRLYDQGWRDAEAVAKRNRLRESEKRRTALATVQSRWQQQLDEAMEMGRSEGFRSGLQLAQARENTRERPQERPRERARAQAPASRNSILEQVEAQCRIIAESNPNMKPAINALRHRLKKI